MMEDFNINQTALHLLMRESSSTLHHTVSILGNSFKQKFIEVFILHNGGFFFIICLDQPRMLRKGTVISRRKTDLWGTAPPAIIFLYKLQYKLQYYTPTKPERGERERGKERVTYRGKSEIK